VSSMKGIPMRLRKAIAVVLLTTIALPAFIFAQDPFPREPATGQPETPKSVAEPSATSPSHQPSTPATLHKRARPHRATVRRRPVRSSPEPLDLTIAPVPSVQGVTLPPGISLSPDPTTPAEYLSGEATVTIKGNNNPIIRVGLARPGVSLVEFPASDRFFALHPGNSDLVTIDDSPTKQNDHFFAFRAGTTFVPPSSRALPGPSASIIAQMRSGLVVTFLIYPVRELTPARRERRTETRLKREHDEPIGSVLRGPRCRARRRVQVTGARAAR
jgi:hypothetical protein